jgi:hypothetical protein
MLPRYFLASVLSLGVDYSIYLVLLRVSPGLSPAVAAQSSTTSSRAASSFLGDGCTDTSSANSGSFS